MSEAKQQKVALVTGASRGIGRGIAAAVAGEGYSVAINYNSNREAAEEAAGLVEQAGGRALIVQADIGSSADRQRLIDETFDAFGRLDLLVNNAGVAPKVRADIMEMGEDSFDYVVGTNLKGPFFLTQYATKRMLEQAAPGSDSADNEIRGMVVNISSISAYTASVNRAEYCIAKAGVSMATQLFAARLANEGIRVYEVRPGIIATDMTSGVQAKYDKLILEDGITPIRRWGRPEDIADAVVAIAAGRFSFSTGEVFNVDGGFHMHRL